MAATANDGSRGTGGKAVDDKKRQLRSLLLERRDGTSADYLSMAARHISERVLACPEISGASAIGAYYSIGSEVPTAGIIREILKDGKRLYMPRVTSGMGMEFCAVRSESELGPGSVRSEIMEPVGRVDAAAADEMDAIVVPAVAASRDGHRLGYGLGYYDRFLARCRKDAFKVAPVLEKQVVKGVPAGPHDVRMDAIVTESSTTYVRQP